MPTIVQLPSASQVTAADSLPISQAGVTHSVSVGTLLASMQPAVMTETGTLLGRVSLGAGGPEKIGVGLGLVITGGTLAASGADHASFPQETTLTPTDQVVVESSGNPRLLPLSLLRGLFSAGANVSINSAGTISASSSGGGGGNAGQSAAYSITNLPAVATVTATDLVAISQSGSDHTITYQNFLDGLTIDLAQPAVPATDSDTFWVAQGSSTMLRQTFAAIWSWLTPKLPSYKLPVVELTTNTTLDGIVHNGRILICSKPITLSPASLNMGSGFYCDVINPSSGVVTFAPGITTSSGVSTLPSGQSASLRVASYSGGTIVFATIAGGTGGGSAVAGAVTAVTWGMWPSGSYTHGAGSIGVNAHITPSTAAVQFGFSTSATTPPAICTVATYVNTDLWGAYVSTPGTAGTWYAWVEGTDGSKPTVYPTPFTVT
jgi:hypothetical protein